MYDILNDELHALQEEHKLCKDAKKHNEKLNAQLVKLSKEQDTLTDNVNSKQRVINKLTAENKSREETITSLIHQLSCVQGEVYYVACMHDAIMCIHRQMMLIER